MRKFQSSATLTTGASEVSFRQSQMDLYRREKAVQSQVELYQPESRVQSQTELYQTEDRVQKTKSMDLLSSLASWISIKNFT